MRPGLAGVGRLVDAVADREVGPRQPFAAADVDDVRIGRRDGDPADRSGRLIVEDRLPGAAGVGRLPDAAVHHADVEGVRLARMAGGRLGPPGAKRADVAPPHLGEQAGRDLRRLLRGERNEPAADDGCRERQNGHETTGRHAIPSGGVCDARMLRRAGKRRKACRRGRREQSPQTEERRNEAETERLGWLAAAETRQSSRTAR